MDNQQPSSIKENYSKYIGLKKGVLVIEDIIRKTPNNKHTIVKCKCIECGEYSEVYLDRFTTSTKYAENYCKHCRDIYLLKRAKEKYIGMKNGTLECIDIVFSDNGRSKFTAICKCSNCGEIIHVRPDRLSSKRIPKGCSNCINSFYKKSTTQRYKDLYKCDGIEYK